MELVNKKTVTKVVDTEITLKLTAKEFANLVAAHGKTSGEDRGKSKNVDSGHLLNSLQSMPFHNKLVDMYDSMTKEGFYEF